MPITQKNVLDLLSASKFLGFTEDIAPENLHGQCCRFLEMESTNGIQGIFAMLVHSSANESYVTDYEVLFDKLAGHALELQDSGLDRADEIVGLLSDLMKLKPGFVNAALRDFERRGVNMVSFLWHKETPASLDSILGGAEDCRANRSSILTYFMDSLDAYMGAGKVEVDWIDAKKLLRVWSVLQDPSVSRDAIKARVSSELHNLSAGDIMGLGPELIQDLLHSAVSASRSGLSKEEEIRRLRDLADEVSKLGSPSSKHRWVGGGSPC